MRDKDNEKKMKPLKDHFKEALDEVEFVNFTLEDTDSIVAACQGATYVVHTAAPGGLEGAQGPRRVDQACG